MIQGTRRRQLLWAPPELDASKEKIFFFCKQIKKKQSITSQRRTKERQYDELKNIRPKDATLGW